MNIIYSHGQANDRKSAKKTCKFIFLFKNDYMEVEKIFHMKEGVGEKSYANNSSLQKTVISRSKPFVQNAVTDLYCNTLPECFTIADLGCSSGPNSLFVVSDILKTVNLLRKVLDLPSPEFHVFLNDLPGNDFNTIFSSTPYFYKKMKKDNGDDFGPCFVSGVPGSFYGRLFPSNSLNFVHSSYSLHWLSQVPCGFENNKGNVYMAKTSPPDVFKAYSQQFNKDFATFIRSRSKEIVTGGCMALTMIGRKSIDPSSKDCCHFGEVFSKSLRDMVSEGFIEEAKLNSFNLPYYTPHIDEIEAIIKSEGSFHLDRVGTFETDWDNWVKNDGVYDSVKSGNFVAKTARAVTETMVASHFGESVVDDFYSRYAQHASEILAKERPKNYNLVISLTKSGWIDH